MIDPAATGNRGQIHSNIFLISPQKHRLLVLIRSASPRHFNEYPQLVFRKKLENYYVGI